MQAVIFIGASSISMIIAEKSDTSSNFKLLDELSQPLDLAAEVFGDNKISHERMHRCVEIIQDYLHLVREYEAAGPVNLQLRGSNILMDLDTMDSLVNRISITTGLRLKVMDDGEMTRLLYVHGQGALQQHSELQNKRVLMLHFGPGNTRVMIMDKGRISHYARYRMGSLRLAEHIHTGGSLNQADERSLIREHLRAVIEQISYDCDPQKHGKIDALIIIAPEYQHLAGLPTKLGHTGAEQLRQFANHVSDCSLSQRVEQYELDYASVRGLLPSAVFYQYATARLNTPQTVLHLAQHSNSYLHGLLPNEKQRIALQQEVLHFSTLLANKYHVDRKHCDQVAKLSCMLFDQLLELHGLDSHDRLLLQAAAMLQEVGVFIAPKKHQHHGQYIILNSEHFGLSRVDVEILSLLVRYHRQGTPNRRQRFYAEMEERDRMRVQKLAAILRVGNAMESGHAYRIHSFKVKINGKRIDIIIPDIRELSMENIALRDKGDLFTDIFGYELSLIAALG